MESLVSRTESEGGFGKNCPGLKSDDVVARGHLNSLKVAFPISLLGLASVYGTGAILSF